jgi:hypothetical protein
MWHRLALLLLLALAISGCGGGGLAAVALGPPDQPVAASESRASLLVRIDLRQGAACEQDYDVALYESRALVLIEWAEPSPRCRSRLARVHYLPKRISKVEVVELLSKYAAARVTPLDEPRS